MPRLVRIWRHPIKSHGREALERVALTAGETMPWDRTWAVAHVATKADGSKWEPCANFSIGAKVPGLTAISSQLDEDRGVVHLTHPDLGSLQINPDTQGDALIDWTLPLIPVERPSARVVRVPNRGMTDTDYPSVSIGNLATHLAIEQKLGRRLSTRRWRINLWVDGLAPWEEFEWAGKTLQIGDVALNVVEPITRCKATTANPDTGIRDTDTLGLLNSWGHQEMGMYTEVAESGMVALQDEVRLL